MKGLNLICLFAIGCLNLPGFAQAQTDCGCQRVRPNDELGFTAAQPDYEEKDAQAIIDSYRLFFVRKYAITASRYACLGNSAYAKLCGLAQHKYIFYNSEFLTKLRAGASWGDQFVLAHEIAHHLLGHTTRAYYLYQEPGQQIAVQSSYQNTTIVTGGNTNPSKTHIINIPERHLHELEADALALWLVIKKGATHDNLRTIFEALPQTVPLFERNADSDTHPSFAMRERMLDRQWEKLKKPDYLKRYLANHEQSSRQPRSIDRKGNPIEDDTWSAYSFEMRVAGQKLINKMNATEKSIRDSLTHHSRFFADIVVGTQYQRPVLSRNNQFVAATDSRSLLGGICLGVGPWHKPSRLEVDFWVVNSSFATQTRISDELRTVERFNSTYLQISPRYVYSRLLPHSDQYRNRGWMATAGLAVTVPLTFRYVNYSVVTYQIPNQLVAVSPVVGVGYGLSNWRNSIGHYRFWIRYQPQLIHFSTPAPDPVRSTLHTIDFTVSFRFW